MRVFTFLAMLIAFNGLIAQITTMQDGYFHDPTTWNCNCIPEDEDELIIQHTITATQFVFFAADVTIMPSGMLIINSSAIDGEPFINIYFIDIRGTLYVDGPFNLFNPISVSGTLVTTGDISVGNMHNIELENGHISTDYLNIGPMSSVWGMGTICMNGCFVLGEIYGTQINACGPNPPAPGEQPCSESGSIIGLIWCDEGINCTPTLAIPPIASASSITISAQNETLLITSTSQIHDNWTIVDGLGRVCQRGHISVQPGTPESVSIQSLTGGLYSFIIDEPTIRSTRFFVK